MWPFKKKANPIGDFSLHFKSGEAFFEYQCKYGSTEIKRNQGLVALVLDAQKEFDVPVSIKIEPDGRQMAMIKVVAEDGGFVVPSYTPSGKGVPLQPDDVVIWVPLEYNKTVANGFGDERAGWVGLIRAKIAPEGNMVNGPLKILYRYD